MIQVAELHTLIAFSLYGLACLLYGLLWKRGDSLLLHAARYTLVAAVAFNLYQLFSRWLITNQPPFKTLYETLVLLAVCIALIYLAIELIFRARILGVAAGFGSAMTMLYALVGQDKETINLPPALQSGWFIPHVVVYFFGYAALFIACAAAAIYLFRPAPIKTGKEHLFPAGTVDLYALMDNAVRFGYVLLTLGLLIGAVWAKQAWGDYWTWDPKENWSLVTWLIFTAYLHLQYIGGWKGRSLALVVIIGFAAVLFTYLGINLLPTADQSVHVYQ
jgi:cytochrome c-type biogenesis protein CcsB